MYFQLKKRLNCNKNIDSMIKHVTGCVFKKNCHVSKMKDLTFFSISYKQ